MIGVWTGYKPKCPSLAEDCDCFTSEATLTLLPVLINTCGGWPGLTFGTCGSNRTPLML